VVGLTWKGVPLRSKLAEVADKAVDFVGVWAPPCAPKPTSRIMGSLKLNRCPERAVQTKVKRQQTGCGSASFPLIALKGAVVAVYTLSACSETSDSTI
jgi:hypothetical protein